MAASICSDPQLQRARQREGGYHRPCSLPISLMKTLKEANGREKNPEQKAYDIMMDNLPMYNKPDKGGKEWHTNQISIDVMKEVAAISAATIIRYAAMEEGEVKKSYFNGWLNTIIRYAPLRFLLTSCE
jgi:hypothetical protein